jgi:hypothetical protein
MVIGVILTNALLLAISLLIMFVFIKAAVKSALEDKMERIRTVLRREEEEDVTEVDDVVKLRDFGILSDDELEAAGELYQVAKEKEENHKTYIKYEKVLMELKTIGYFSDEHYQNKIEALKQHLNID